MSQPLLALGEQPGWRDRVAERPGRTIGVIVAARDLITFVFYGNAA
jgi:hypothetical protein